MKTKHLTLLVLASALLVATGCATRLGENPLEGWSVLGTAFVIRCPFGETVAADYQNYIQSLPDRERASVHPHDIRFYENEDQHAVEISIPINGIWWKHVLFYDKGNKRAKVVRYAASRYMS